MKLSVVIPTYNRAKELEETLFSVMDQLKHIQEVIVVDQSKNNETKKLIERLGEKKIKYVYSKIPSIAIARNLGVRKASSKSDLICFLDDDVTLEKGYFEEVKKAFIKNKDLKGVAGFPKMLNSPRVNYFSNFIKRFFIISFFEENARILGPYCNTASPIELKKEIYADWFQGVNMCYKREVFDFQKFDENLLGYTVAEDIDFSYRLSKKFPNSLLITPKAGIIHRYSLVERAPTRKISYINQVDHFYFYYKNMRTFKHTLIFLWELFGITLLRTLFLFSFRKKYYLKWKYYIESLFYCIGNLEKIKKGKVREWEQFVEAKNIKDIIPPGR